MPHNRIDNHPEIELPELESALITEQIYNITQNRLDLLGNELSACIASAVLWRLYPKWLALCWLGVFSLVILARLLLRRHYQHVATDPAIMLRWGRVFTANAFATGCLWSLTGSVVLVTTEPLYILFTIFVLGGMMAGCVVRNSAYMPVLYAFILPTVLPVIVVLLTRHNLIQDWMGVLLAIFTLVLLNSGYGFNRSIIEKLRLRISQNLLVEKLRESEAVMAKAQEIAQVGSWDIDLIAQTYSCSVEANRIFGVDAAKPKPSYSEMLARIHPDDREMVSKKIQEMIVSGIGYGTEHRLVMDDGTIRYVHEQARVEHGTDGRALHAVGTVQDITARKLAEDKLKFANVLLRTEAEASLAGILVVDRNRKIISSNQRFREIWDISQEMIAAGIDGAVLAKVVDKIKDKERFVAQVERLYENQGASSEDEYELTDGRFIERHTVALTDPEGEYLGRIWFFRDITENKLATAHALRMTRFDGLTGLANRSVFVEALQHEAARAKRGEKGFAVMYIDLDHFKDVNDTLGHPVGDAFLQEVAARLLANTRETDTVARFGGDEFAVVVTDIEEPADAAMMANKLIKALSQAYSIRGNDVYSSASIGIDLYGPEACDAETLLSHADVALYRAKAEGRASYRFFTDAMDAEVMTRISLGMELHEAIDEGQLFLLYQPQVATGSSRMVGVESLVRWNHPKRGILRPDVFIPVAERTGLIIKLGHAVLMMACRQAKAWLDAGLEPIRIAVNVSVMQFKSPMALEADIIAVLDETGLPPQMLELELTETVLMNVAREHRDILVRLRQHGVMVAIDDFGTGYSSLDYLRRFPVDRIKIAQNFVRHIETVAGDASIVKATIGLARELGIAVIAEGVETAEQLELLKKWGCAEVQGYYFARPLAVDEITEMLRKGGTLDPHAQTIR
ncbi:MAG: EAL domain-containing protein [Acidobacteriaceae bacterium]|nr:EAL domain-containing protein [Acidobacteriaceae bacterium]